MVGQKVLSVVRKFATSVRKHNIRIDKVILYGSQTTGRTRRFSDIDVAVVSADFGKERFDEGVRLRLIAYEIDPRIDPVPLSTKAYRKDTWLPLIHEIRTKGVEVK
jgi:predicted nucleotidyltransferase